MPHGSSVNSCGVADWLLTVPPNKCIRLIYYFSSFGPQINVLDSYYFSKETKTQATHYEIICHIQMCYGAEKLSTILYMWEGHAYQMKKYEEDVRSYRTILQKANRKMFSRKINEKPDFDFQGRQKFNSIVFYLQWSPPPPPVTSAQSALLSVFVCLPNPMYPRWTIIFIGRRKRKC